MRVTPLFAVVTSYHSSSLCNAYNLSNVSCDAFMRHYSNHHRVSRLYMYMDTNIQYMMIHTISQNLKNGELFKQNMQY